MINKIATLGGYIHEYQKSVANPQDFWSQIAESFYWRKKWDRVLEWDFKEPEIKWFINGKLNITENIFERHQFTRGDQPAIIWEPNNPKDDNRTLTYFELFTEVKKFANVLLGLGIKKGDRIAIYMPMVPELAISMLACARIGAIHSVVFAGFSANSLADRINDAEAKLVLTSDGGFRGSKITPIKEIVDEALESCTTVESVVMVQRTHTKVNVKDGRDFWWHDLMNYASDNNKAEEMDAEDMLFILYTSGSTDKPKGIVHTIGGYMVYSAYSFKNVFQYSDGDIYFCSADIGWITGHSYIVYGPLLCGATSLMFEGIPTYPDAGRYWDIVDKYKVNQFYTAPTAIRSLIALGQEFVENRKMDSLKVLGTVGEPINEEAWHWYHDHVGGNKCPIVDTWWQTETGGIAISPLAGIIPTKPSFATLPLPGIQPIIVDAEGKELPGKSVEGNLCIKYPWPGILRTVYKDHARFKKTYFSSYEGLYFTGDGVKRDEDGYYRILGRVDDVINVSGHRMGTAEVENAINEHPLVNESAVVGYPHPIKGQGIYAYVVCGELSAGGEPGITDSIKKGVTKIIGPIAKPDKILLVDSLPKTRSGKIMRRILRKIAEGDYDNFGDISTLLDTSVVEQIVERAQNKAQN
ncbi:MAG: acetate--CoA ligase [Bacteroidetes bacterium]|jgi:acetyl-CoA synthetase|nr:acetate--CoA ligase [Bacteroidota bacterium]MBT3750229.1 acetate--CoA ligase [Bacteroidota bacterium]MBT4408236.1 acetate--CoA ligase [Bacteroidota bacterium]MBT5425094.1 acetate--CoA ligase [Bacteroidota bacterium]MBT7093758.1 acetate--CoA ligase [Bacteroidota bacterium]